MNRIIAILLLLPLGTILSQAQEKVKEKDLAGEWQMVFDIDEEEWEDEIEDASFLGRMIAGSVSGLVVNVLEDLEIRFEFLNNNEIRMTVEIWGEKEIEYIDWYINRYGELIIGDEDDDDEIWLFKDDKLVSYDKRGADRYWERSVFLVRDDSDR